MDSPMTKKKLIGYIKGNPNNDYNSKLSLLKNQTLLVSVSYVKSRVVRYQI